MDLPWVGLRGWRFRARRCIRPTRSPIEIDISEMMMKYAALLATLAASASAFTPVQQPARSAVSSLSAEKSESLPFMNRPPLVSE